MHSKKSLVIHQYSDIKWWYYGSVNTTVQCYNSIRFGVAVSNAIESRPRMKSLPMYLFHQLLVTFVTHTLAKGKLFDLALLKSRLSQGAASKPLIPTCKNSDSGTDA